MRLWARAAASPAIGLGHLLRQVSLVEQATAHGVPATFVVDNLPLAASALDRFTRLGAAVVGADTGWYDDVLPGDLVVFDGYQFDASDHAAAREVGAVVAAVDDRGSGRFEVDLLCDHNPVDVDYDLPAAAVLLHGLRYALVRGEFRGGRSPGAHEATHLLVAFGGTDALGLLPAALEGLSERTVFPTVTLLVGPGSPALDRPLPTGISAVASPRDLAAVHGSADAALITLGTTLWELLLRGTPVATIGLEPLHHRIAAVVAAEGGALEAGGPDDWLSRLPSTLGDLAEPQTRSRLQRNGRRLVDGRGAERVFAALMRLRVS